ncbi:MAG: hypothetical protein CBD26_03465 [Candidatus Pelagibacter sp. TMED166]|nr:MAG: hypothetical protein CBD26_03465 [Candidatus Pelagibacter sp. TMED166]|tara:strand:+ start:9152 stop:9343 length:192 start_codon:yes stop_codon:yes gene_type:complete
MQITKGNLRKLIKEEIDRLASDEDIVAGTMLAENVIEQIVGLSEKQRHAFLTKFVSFLTEKNT